MFNTSKKMLLSLATCLICLASPVHAQGELFILDSAQADLDGDRVPERILLLSPDSPDPSHRKSKKELRILKQKGDRYQTVYTMPIRSGFATKTMPWQFEDTASKLWGLQIEAGKPRARLWVVFATSSGDFFRLVFDGKTYHVESSGDHGL